MKIDITGALEKLEREFPREFVSVQVELEKHVGSDAQLEWRLYAEGEWSRDGDTFEKAFESLKELKQKSTKEIENKGSFIE